MLNRTQNLNSWRLICGALSCVESCYSGPADAGITTITMTITAMVMAIMTTAVTDIMVMVVMAIDHRRDDAVAREPHGN